jgi:DNA-directed RNA polymerase specialized sigma24 family protein
MVESTFEDFPSADNEEILGEKSAAGKEEEVAGDDPLLSALPVVQGIVRRKFARKWASDGIDLVQGIFLRLLKWRNKYREKSDEMSDEEWRSIAARTAFNEINRHFSKKRNFTDVPLEQSSELLARDAIKGNSDAEVCSVARQIWQEICKLTLRQRRALIFGNREMVFYFLQCGITNETFAEILNLPLEEWLDILEKLPLEEKQIAALIQRDMRVKPGSGENTKPAARSVKKARYEAREKLRRLQK